MGGDADENAKPARQRMADGCRACPPAETAGLGIDPFLRSLILGVQLRPRPPDTYAALLRELSAIGNNINQIAHTVNGQKYAADSQIDQAVALVRRAWRLVKDSF